MKYFFVLTLFSISFFCNAQVGIGVETELGLYEWYKQPKNGGNVSRSSGQLLSLPSVGPKIWFGDWHEWTISLESKIIFSPFAFNLQDKKGFGSLAFPILVGGNFRIDDDEGTVKLGIAAGVQWSKSELFNRDISLPQNAFYLTFIGEVNFQFVIGVSPGFKKSYDYDTGHNFTYFMRFGKGRNKSTVFSTGLKYAFRGHPFF